MKKVIIVFFLMICFPMMKTAGQESNISIKTRIAYGAYDMEGLKELQKDLLGFYTRMNLPTRIVENFPPYWTYQVQLSGQVNPDFSLGLVGGIASTGGRIHYQDYSGEVVLDMLAARRALGLALEWNLSNRENIFQTSSTLQITGFRQHVDINETMSVGEQDFTDDAGMKSSGFGVELGVLSGPDWHHILIQGYTGLHISFSKSFKPEDETNDLTPLINRSTTLTWSGFRAGILIGYKF